LTKHSFYHLQRQPLEAALPKLLESVYGAGLRAVVQVSSPERVKDLNKLLWTYDPGGFLPHGTKSDGEAADQPIYLTTANENPNGASVLVLVDGADALDVSAYDRCLYMFDGNDPAALEAARERWRRCAEGTAKMTYWQQSAQGGWQEKASANADENSQ
jgi:DNA polymerase-3 subunit chi